MLCFVNERKGDYYRMSEQFEDTGLVIVVVRNVGVWHSRSNTLSVLDCTILTPVANTRLGDELKAVFEGQVSSLGYEKQVFGTLEFTNFNSVVLQNVCFVCKSWKVRCLPGGGHCNTCAKPVTLLELPRLEGRITLRDRSSISVTLVGNIADKVLFLPEPFKQLYSRSVLEAREMLARVKRVGTFVLNHVGKVMSFSASSDM